MSTKKYSVTVIPDSSNVEHFTVSSCNCRKCRTYAYDSNGMGHLYSSDTSPGENEESSGTYRE